MAGNVARSPVYCTESNGHGHSIQSHILKVLLGNPILRADAQNPQAAILQVLRIWPSPAFLIILVIIIVFKKVIVRDIMVVMGAVAGSVSPAVVAAALVIAHLLQ